jgi:hypothetical protein
MAHLVRHRTDAGETVTTEVDDLDAAVAMVEHLRNDEAADDVRVYAEVPLRFETYVRVSVATEAPAADTAPSTDSEAGEAADEPPAPATPAAPVPPPPGVLAPVRVEAPSADAEELVDAAPADGRRGLFHRS